MLHLIHYGRSGFVGRFRSDALVPRGERVVIRSPRGLEVGTVLCDAAGEPDGDLLRVVTAADEAALGRAEALGRDLLAAAAATELPITVVDAEVSLDAAAAVLHGLPWGACDADPLLAGLSDRFGLAVRLFDLSRVPGAEPEPEPAGCGKPGCGSEGGGCSSCGTGGCSTGSCSRGSVQKPEQLTSYFADLRHKMEAAGVARTPLT